MTTKNEINEIGEEIDLYKIETNLVNNVVPKPEEFGNSSRRNSFPKTYVCSSRTDKQFFFRVYSKENHNL